MFIGLIWCFFWLLVFGLAKDRARCGKGYLYSSLFSLGLVFAFLFSFFGGVLSLVFGVILGDYAMNSVTTILDFLMSLMPKWWEAIGVIGFMGTVCSALLGAHFGVIMYHQYDKSK